MQQCSISFEGMYWRCRFDIWGICHFILLPDWFWVCLVHKVQQWINLSQANTANTVELVDFELKYWIFFPYRIAMTTSTKNSKRKSFNVEKILDTQRLTSHKRLKTKLMRIFNYFYLKITYESWNEPMYSRSRASFVWILRRSKTFALSSNI